MRRAGVHSEHWKTWAALAAVVLFVVADAVALLNHNYIIMAVPAVLLALVLMVSRLELSLIGMAFLTPFSVDAELLQGMDLSLPVEPLMMIFSLIFLVRAVLERPFGREFFKHPVTIAVLVMLGWMIVTSALSQLPLVSFKHTAAQMWFIVTFYFGGCYVFRNRNRIGQFFWAYAIGLIAIILLSTMKTIGHLHDLPTLHHAMRPFYNDHTAYGCVIALMLPAAFYFIFSRDSHGWNRLWWAVLFGIMALGLYLSFSRAAWISLVAAVGVFFAVKMGMKVKWMMVVFALGVGLVYTYQGDLLYRMGKNNVDSSADLGNQVKSISNISTDASNLERLNRWASALRMWEEHPVTGTGAGTGGNLWSALGDP